MRHNPALDPQPRLSHDQPQTAGSTGRNRARTRPADTLVLRRGLTSTARVRASAQRGLPRALLITECEWVCVRGGRRVRADRRLGASGQPTCVVARTARSTDSGCPCTPRGANRGSRRTEPRSRWARRDHSPPGREHLPQCRQRRGHHRVPDVAATPLAGDQPRLRQHLQMVADGGLALAGRACQLAGADASAAGCGKQAEQPQPHRVGQRRELAG